MREVYDTPAWAQAYMERIGGRNRFGEPNLRVVWSNSRLDWIGGKFEERDSEGSLIREVFKLARMPKYPIENRWVIELWYPPEHFGSPKLWFEKTKEYVEEGNIPQLGPYPEHGKYEFCSVLETWDGQFMQLQPHVLDDFFMELKRQIGNKGIASYFAEKNAIKKRHEKKVEQDAEWVKEEMRSPLFVEPAVTVL
jgi:hypothetical protein